MVSCKDVLVAQGHYIKVLNAAIVGTISIHSRDKEGTKTGWNKHVIEKKKRLS
jgi:hypothetical protein